MLNGHIEAATDYSGVSHGHGAPDFHFSRMEEIMRGHPARWVKVDGTDALFINDPMLVRVVQVKDSRNYGRGDLFQKGRNISKAGLLLEDDSTHRHYRRLSNPFLRAAKVDEYLTDMRTIASDAVAPWRAGRAVDIQTEMCWISSAIALAALFPSPRPEMSRTLSDRLAVLIRETIRTPLYGAAAQRQRSSSTPLVRAREALREPLLSYIDEQLCSPHPTSGYVPALLSDTDERGDRVLTVDQVCDEAIMMLTAATATIASVMSWVFYVLSDEPVVEERLLEDMAEVGNRSAARHGNGDASYTSRFLMEVLRLYPPVWIACRKTRSAATLGEYSLPGGVNVVFSTYLLHRDPGGYPDPGRFDPDRWLTVRPGIADSAMYVPFGIGPKACIGEAFAWPELATILGAVMQRWRLSTKPGSWIHAAAETTLHPHELVMIPQPR